MMCNVVNFVSKMLILLFVLALTVARPQHFGEMNQITGDDTGSTSLQAPALSDSQLEFLAQKLSEYNSQTPTGWDPRWERIIRAPEMKRQSRFRQCYFNPVSCFKK